MSIFLVKTLNIRGSWGLCPQTPLASGGWGLRPHTSGWGTSLPNPGCVTGKAYKVLLPSEILGWPRHWVYNTLVERPSFEFSSYCQSWDMRKLVCKLRKFRNCEIWIALYLTFFCLPDFFLRNLRLRFQGLFFFGCAICICAFKIFFSDCGICICASFI